MFRPALVLVLTGLVAAIVLAGLDLLTGERIEQQQHARALSEVTAIMPRDLYDNRLIDDTAMLVVGDLPRPATVYRARLEGRPSAAVIDVTTPHGYSGDIRLLVAAHLDGTVLGVRVLEHRETPGLGDRIEHTRSNWIDQFTGRSLGDPPAERWAPDQRKGDFDTLTSATITASAVTSAVREVLAAFETERETLFDQPDDEPAQ